MSWYIKAFKYLVPNSTWVCYGDQDVYENFVWLSSDTQPSKEQCDQIIVDLKNKSILDGIKRDRQAAYQIEADPLYFGWQRGENTEQAWLEKVADIRARYPYPA